MQISWDSFKLFNIDSRGIRMKFEDLCRQLFSNEMFANNTQFKYLHANPNNCGLETEPVFDENHNEWIGFQAKFFDNAVDYKQIYHSAEKTVEYYCGKLNKIYLFCNKPITETSNSYKAVVKLLNDNGIDIQLITDEAILDRVRDKYPYLALYYFGNHQIQMEWFKDQAEIIYQELGERYNKSFNVVTTYDDELSLFVHDNRAVKYLNNKKASLINRIDELSNNNSTYKSYLLALRDQVSIISDVTIENLCDSETWFDNATSVVDDYLESINKELQKLQVKRKKLTHNIKIEKKGDSQTDIRRDIWKIDRKTEMLKELEVLPEMLSLTPREKLLLHSKIMTVQGDAGAGKTQLLATKTNSLLCENRKVLFLAAGIYYSNDAIYQQIMNNLRLDYGIDELFDILETIGEAENVTVPVIIDALNETWNNKLWKSGLPSIINKINKCYRVKLILSYRSDYESAVLPESIIGNEDVVSIFHRGFENDTISAVKEFLDYYSIPFTPLDFFGYEMSNPLFLSLYCKTYDGQEVSLPKLYEKLVLQINKKLYAAQENLFRSKGITEDLNIVSPLINELSQYMINQGTKSISKDDIDKLGYWSKYGLPPMSIVMLLVKEKLLYVSVYEDVERFYFAYDQMNDYFGAKAILKQYKSKEDIKQYLSEVILGIKDSNLQNTHNIDLFVNASVLFAEKYDEECIDIIDGLNADDQWLVFSRFIQAYQWREKTGIKADRLIDYLQKYPCRPDDLWPVLLSNSVKLDHPLNANYLHGLLSHYELTNRDYLWTTYINQLPLNEADRIVQLITIYNSKNSIIISDNKQIELLLILLTWFLTSSNRWLRDTTSKAMVELLKDHLDLSIVLLEKFTNVNDPYVLQRLYGVIFGATCKRSNGDLLVLAEYVYKTVFDQAYVYPDILLRDYARLIIERFLYEDPSYDGIIEREIITPPYNSSPIPEVEDKHYSYDDFSGSQLQVFSSMKFEKMGVYGDFGRYVFQSALNNFDVDEQNIFNYALSHIFDEIGFDNTFDDYDQNLYGFDRHLTTKTERIGKKYQWITMFNILARVSDNNKMINRWGDYPEKTISYKGPWDPYIRDFDPTLNPIITNHQTAPLFSVFESLLLSDRDEKRGIDLSNQTDICRWKEVKGQYLETLSSIFILSDSNNEQWVLLTNYFDTGRTNLDVEKLFVWNWSFAYFMDSKQAEYFENNFERGRSILTSEITSYSQTYTVYNYEFPWAPSCEELISQSWVKARIQTGETTRKTVIVPNFEMSDDGIATISQKETVQVLVDEMDIGNILQATTELTWEEEYDGSIEEHLSFSYPCAELLENMKLSQITDNGFLFDEDGKLAAFDTYLTQKHQGVVIRKDILDRYLAKNDYKLVWFVDAEKEVHAADRSIDSWSRWEGLFIYEGDHVDGDIQKIDSKGSNV